MAAHPGGDAAGRPAPLALAASVHSSSSSAAGGGGGAHRERQRLAGAEADGGPGAAHLDAALYVQPVLPQLRSNHTGLEADAFEARKHFLPALMKGEPILTRMHTLSRFPLHVQCPAARGCGQGAATRQASLLENMLLHSIEDEQTCGAPCGWP